MRYSTYNDNRYNATVHKDNNKLDVKVGNPENKKHIPGSIIEYGVKSVNGKYGDVVLTYEDVGALPDTTIIAQYVDENGDSHIINSWNNTEIDGNTFVILTCDDTSVVLPTDDALNNKIIEALNQIAQDYVSYSNIGDGLVVNNHIISAKLGNGLEFDTNKAIQIEDGVIFNCGTSNTVI